MGYVNVTDITKFIPPSKILKTAGTWTPAISSNVISEARGAADEAVTLLIPVDLEGADVALQGAKLQSVDIWYKIATAAADDFATVAASKVTLPATGSAITGAAVTVTCDADHDTAAERKAVGDHKMTVTLSTPAFLEDNEAIWLSLVIDCAATTVLTIYGAQANFDLRL
jgi:hypothetical protein